MIVPTDQMSKAMGGPITTHTDLRSIEPTSGLILTLEQYLGSSETPGARTVCFDAGPNRLKTISFTLAPDELHLLVVICMPSDAITGSGGFLPCSSNDVFYSVDISA